MEQPKQPTGNFIAFFNRDKQPGDNRPAFDGRLSTPGIDDELRFALWSHEYTDPKTGETKVMFNGQIGAVDAKASALAQVAAITRNTGNADATIGNLTLAARQVVLFPNGFKADAPDKDRPDYWGAVNPGNGNSIIRISMWAKKDRKGNPMLTGATSYPIPGKTEAEQQAAQEGLAQQVERGEIGAGAAKGKSGKGRG